MNKFIKSLVCIGMSLSLMGCSINNIYSRSATNQIENVCSNCKQVDGIVALLDNVEKVMNTVQAISGEYELVNTKDTFKFSFDIITKEKKIDWELFAEGEYSDKKMQFYARDKKFYIVYPYNGANVILKDNVENMVNEIEDTLDNLNATYDKENLTEIITGGKLVGFDFEKMKEDGNYLLNGDGTYTVSYSAQGVDWYLDISTNFLVKEVRSSAENFTSKLVIEYPKEITITYPNGLDFITLDIEDTKNLLEINSFSELVDPEANAE